MQFQSFIVIILLRAEADLPLQHLPLQEAVEVHAVLVVGERLTA